MPKKKNGCAENVELDPILEAIRQRFSQLEDEACERRHLLNRLRNLARFGVEPVDYEELHCADLPKELEIGFAVCHPECGNQAYVVVEGGPQGCDWCGGTMLPVDIRTYRLTRKQVTD